LEKSKSELTGELKQLEKKHGVIGFHDMKEGLEKISEQKGEIDEKKGQTMEEISRVVLEI
jgi:intraflagellar transport protein 81